MVLAAAVITSAVPYLTISDLIVSVMDGCFRAYRRKPLLGSAMEMDNLRFAPSGVMFVYRLARELPMNAVVALFHADMVLTAYVDPMDFRSRTIQGGIELGVSYVSPVEKSHIHGAPERNPAQTLIADSSEKWGYLLGSR